MRVLAVTLLFASLFGLVACNASTPAVQDISQKELLATPPVGAIILDVRSEEEFTAGHLPEAANIPHDELASRLSELEVSKTSPIVVYCERGGRASKATAVLLDAGYTDVLHLTGDMSEWRANGLPVEVATADVAAAESASEAPSRVDVAALRTNAAAIFGTLPPSARSAEHPSTQAKIDLGRMLYYDARLSKNHDIACNSCHLLSRFGQDGQATSPGHRGQRGGRNSPTVYNAAFHVAQFWDGRAADVEEQAKGPILNPIEMAMPSEAAVLLVLNSIPGYVDAFSVAFPDSAESLTYDNMAAAIGAFERRLVTPGRFDDFLAGDDEALTASELAGLQSFIESGCITCHMGPTVGGTMYQKLGLVKPYETTDEGRFEVTGQEADRKVFKVPSLRNVAETGPYFHDGSIASLETAVSIMAEHQLGKDLNSQENASIRAFLSALTGGVDAAYIARPTLPQSGPDTPSPDPS